jgi:integrase/recombinase XerD
VVQRRPNAFLNQFHEFIGEFPPTLELFTSFFQRYSSPDIRLSTRARYYYVFSAFFKWYDGSSLPFKVKSPKPVPQKVSDEEVEKFKAVITGRKTHKKSIDRDLLIIELFYNAGLRLSELTNLRVTESEVDRGVSSLERAAGQRWQGS